MENINFQKEMEKVIESFGGEKKRLLLHSCCAPCSSYVLEYLTRYFEITVFYYNPNIYPEAEFQKRLSEQKRLIELAFPQVKLACIGYDSGAFYAAVKGCETLGENSERCRRCYAFRMQKTAETAREQGFDYFTTTLSISPYKNAKWINAIGFALQEQCGTAYLPADFKKKGGYQRSIALCKEYDIYRQHYCGCVFSLEESREMRTETED